MLEGGINGHSFKGSDESYLSLNFWGDLYDLPFLLSYVLFLIEPHTLLSYLLFLIFWMSIIK